MYDNGRIIRYQFPLFDFGGGSDNSFYVRGPVGKHGRLWDYGVQDVSEVFNGDTLDPAVEVGNTSTIAAYGASFTISTADAAVDTAMSVRSKYGKVADLNTYLLPTVEIEPATSLVGALVKFTCLASTGANLTGQAVPFVEIWWQN